MQTSQLIHSRLEWRLPILVLGKQDEDLKTHLTVDHCPAVFVQSANDHSMTSVQPPSWKCSEPPFLMITSGFRA